MQQTGQELPRKLMAGEVGKNHPSQFLGLHPLLCSIFITVEIFIQMRLAFIIMGRRLLYKQVYI